MGLKRISLVIDESTKQDEDKKQNAKKTSLRKLTNCDLFATELAKYTEAEITVVEGYPLFVQPEEFILLYAYGIKETSSEFLENFREQIIYMNTGISEDFNLLSEFGFAGVVSSRLYGLWQRGGNMFIMPCFLGLTMVANEMKVKILREIGNYCDMTDDIPSSFLPAFLVQYMETYAVDYNT